MLLYTLNLSYPLQHLSTMLMDDMSSVAQWSVSSRRAGIIHTTNSYNSPIYIPGTVLSPADALGLTELPVHSRDGNKQYWYYLIW